MNTPRQLAVFCRYEEKGASSRVRFFRYKPFFEKAEIEAHFHSFFDDAYLERLYAGKGRSVAALFTGFKRRWQALQKIPAGVPFLIEYELFPMLWAWFDLSFLKNRPFFLNFDDPVWEKYAKIPTLRNKYDILVRHASGVIVANDLLAERFGKLNANILKIPTAIDLEHYTKVSGSVEKFPRFTLVWIGSPATFPYLTAFQSILKKMAEQCDFQLLIIGKKEWGALPGVPGYSVDWSEEKEAELLSRSHAGIMPLPDDAFAKGKSAYKLIQYAGAGLPSLGAAVGENCQVIKQGKTGFLCRTPEEWCHSLSLLFHDPGLRKEMGENARQEAVHWSLETNARKLIRFIFPDVKGENL